MYIEMYLVILTWNAAKTRASTRPWPGNSGSKLPPQRIPPPPADTRGTGRQADSRVALRWHPKGNKRD